jgi:hypothetical protein
MLQLGFAQTRQVEVQGSKQMLNVHGTRKKRVLPCKLNQLRSIWLKPHCYEKLYSKISAAMLASPHHK